MKVWLLIALTTLALSGCGQRDPIDRVVQEESANHYFRSGPVELIRLPPDAMPEQLARMAAKQDLHAPGSVTKVLETRKVEIMPKGTPKNMIDQKYIDYCTFTAVLVDTDSGRRVVLLQYRHLDTNTVGWWYRIYYQ
jgi:hypothetical protein